MPVTWSLSGLTCFSGPVFVSVSDGFSALLCLHLCFHQFLSLSVSLDVSLCVSPLIWPSASRDGCPPGLITSKPSQRATLIAVAHGVPLSWSTDISVSPNFCLPYPPSGLSLNVTLNFEEPKLHENRDF